MMVTPSVQWELEGELLQLQMKIDKLQKKRELTQEDQEQMEEYEKRKAILERKLRSDRMKM
ncbi:MAG: hypothetical protein IKI81_03840 [Selenomonadaceae bacterium]|nr:hypothetical protein [Selenomonadaceae bacterium]MBR6906484.1 hypothetical protein [Selenomonadaceae bacterium]